MTRLCWSAESNSARLRPLARTCLDSTIVQAVRVMYEYGNDAVAVVDGNQHLVGVFTARDVVGVIGLGLDPKAVTVGQWLRSPRECNSHGPRGEAWLG